VPTFSDKFLALAVLISTLTPSRSANARLSDQQFEGTVSGNQCMVMRMSGAEAFMSDSAEYRSNGTGSDSERTHAPAQGCVVTITRTSNDTGERQEMFGYKARRGTSMIMESN
jgi:hypothetical protein